MKMFLVYATLTLIGALCLVLGLAPLAYMFIGIHAVHGVLGVIITLALLVGAWAFFTFVTTRWYGLPKQF